MNSIKVRHIWMTLFVGLGTFAGDFLHAEGIEFLEQEPKVFLIEGFDSNDLVEIVISGQLPAENFEIIGASASVDSVHKTILLDLNIKKFEAKFFLSEPIPFVTKATIPPLSRGSYKVILKNRLVGELNIAEAVKTLNQDLDYKLATTRTIEVSLKKSKHLITLKGEYTGGPCEISFDTNIAGNTLVILPILHCYSTIKDAKAHRWVQPLYLPEELENLISGGDDVLIHVRSQIFSALRDKWIPDSVYQVIFHDR